MKQRHIAVFTPLMGGHIYPALGVCSELVRRGHHVTYPTTDNHAARICEAGATPVELIAPQLRHVEAINEDSEPEGPKYWRAFLSVIGPLMITTAAATVARLKSYYASSPPDLIIYDWFAFAGRILAKQLGRPAIQLHSHFAHHDSLMRVEGVGTTPEPMLGYAKLLDAFMSTYGFEGRCLWHYEKLNLFLIPRSIQYDAETFDSRFRFVGPTHNRQPGSGTWQNSAGPGKPLLLISETTSSTNGNFLRLCIDAFAESKYHVVVSKAPNSPEATSLPSNFEINRTVFNREILPFASVMVCQGGMGTTLESLYHGVPAVSLPPDMFNAEVAYRLDEMGLGVHIRQRDLTAGTLREGVDRAFSDEAMRQRVKRMQSELISSPGPAGAADSIEQFIESL